MSYKQSNKTPVDELVDLIKNEKVEPIKTHGEGRALENLSFRESVKPKKAWYDSNWYQIGLPIVAMIILAIAALIKFFM